MYSLSSFSMAAGDFLDVYNESEYMGSQDCVTTCFFMDCAHNIVDFIQTIHKVNIVDFIQTKHKVNIVSFIQTIHKVNIVY